MNSKTISFLAIMATLGNVLFITSFYFGPITSGVALDLSLIPVFIVALYGGPRLGFITGAFAGIMPGIYFGPLGSGSWLGLLGLPIGKALTGFTAGLICEIFDVKKKDRSSILTIPLVLISYIPEFIFTVYYFISLLPFFMGGGGIGILTFVLPKAWAEIIFMSLLMAALIGNQGFSTFVSDFVADYQKK